MACQAGAEHVYAFEMFPAMASIATRVTGDCTAPGSGPNDFGEPRCGITVLGMRSTDACASTYDGGGGGSSGGGSGGGSGNAHGGGSGGSSGVSAGAVVEGGEAGLRSGGEAAPPALPRCDILVTEIFDSVLLGEGVLPTLAHAWEHLLAPGAVVVPSAGAGLQVGSQQALSLPPYHMGLVHQW